MKRTTIVIMALFALGALAAPAVAANSKDFKVIQNAVKRAPAAEKGERGNEVTWFKVLIQDTRSSEARVKLTLPIALIEVLLACGDGRRFHVDDDHCEIDLRAVWNALKKAGPLALVEIKDDGAVIKVWLE